MTKKKDKINWFYIGLGFFFILSFFWSDKQEIRGNELETKTIIVSHDIQKILGRRSPIAFRIGSKGNECSFVIMTAGGMAAKWDGLDNITENDTLELRIHNSRLSDLSKRSEDIPIYSLRKNGKLVYNLDAYNMAQKTLDRRWSIIFIIMGVVFLLRGLTIVSSKTSYVLAALCAAIIITLRMAKMWW